MLFGRKPQFVIFIIAGVMITDFVFFGYLPLHTRLEDIGQARAAQKLAISKAADESRRMPLLKEQLQKMQNVVARYQASVPEQRDLGLFLQQIAGLMNEQNLRDQQVQPADEIEAGSLSCIPVNIQGRGRLPQLFEFYKSLQKLDRLVRIERIELTNDNNFSGELTMQTRVVIYYRTGANQG